MGFITPVLLAGAGLIAVPILLHFVMRRQPQLLTFPALQFVKRRQQSNRRKLNLRHWLLLLLRCLLIAGIAAALARPVLRGTGLKGKEGAPLAVAVVVDNSLRMEYVEKNQTRLSAATELATELVRQFPTDTEIAVVDRSHSTNNFVVDNQTAESRLENLVPESNPRPLLEAIRNAIELVAEQTDRRQEIFLFSDLSAREFDEATLTEVENLLTEAKDVRIYTVDVGASKPKNLWLEPVVLGSAALLESQPLRITSTVQSLGYDEAPLVELLVSDSTGKLVKRGQKIIELDDTGTGRVEFVLNELSLGTHQGVLQIATSDPLEFDNQRYFTVTVRPAGKVLLLGEEPSDTLFLQEALQPSFLRSREGASFHCTSKLFSAAREIDLSDFQAVCLLDPPPLSDEMWNKFEAYARAGGGVGVFLGHRATPSGFNTEAAQKLLPGHLKLRSREETYLRPQRLDHPALAGLRNYAEEIPWQIYPVWRYWVLDEESQAGNAFVVARYANSQPALLERPVGSGRVITCTTPVSDALNAPYDPWNLLPTHPEPWVFYALANQVVGYLTQNEEHQINYLAGETATVRLPSGTRITDFVLTEPKGEPMRRSVPPGDDVIRIGSTKRIGNYQISAGGRASTLDQGFSVNADASLSELGRIDPNQILQSLPKDRVHLAQSLDDVEKYVNIGRRGRELFSFAITLVALIWGGEHFLANRFYREEHAE